MSFGNRRFYKSVVNELYMVILPLRSEDFQNVGQLNKRKLDAGVAQMTNHCA